MVIIRVRNNGHCNYILYTLLQSIALLWIHLKLIHQMITWCIYSKIVNMLCGFDVFIYTCIYIPSNWPTNNLSSVAGVIGNWWNFMEQSIWGAPHEFTCYHFTFHTPMHSMQHLTFGLFSVHLTVAHIERHCAVMVKWLEYKWYCSEQKKCEPRPVSSIPVRFFHHHHQRNHLHFNRIVINAKSSNLQTNQRRGNRSASAENKTGPTSFAAFFCRCVHLSIQNLP